MPALEILTEINYTKKFKRENQFEQQVLSKKKSLNKDKKSVLLNLKSMLYTYSVKLLC